MPQTSVIGDSLQRFPSERELESDSIRAQRIAGDGAHPAVGKGERIAVFICGRGLAAGCPGLPPAERGRRPHPGRGRVREWAGA